MPPRCGDPPPGPSPGPQDAFSPALIFPTLLATTVKIQLAFAELDEQALHRMFLNIWAARPPPPANIQAATSILFAAVRRLARLAKTEDNPFETAAEVSPPASSRGAPSGSPALAGLPDVTFPHIDPLDIPAATSPRTVTPLSTKSLLVALLDKDQDDLRALDNKALSLLKDLANRLFRFLQKTPAGTPSSAPKSLPAPTVPAAVQPAEPLTKPQSPPPRPPRSPTQPPPCALGPPLACKATQPTKQSYAKAAASVPAASAAVPVPPKAPMPPSKSAMLRKSCIKQGTKATKVILWFPDSSRQPGINQLWGALAVFKPSDISLTLRGDFILTFPQVLDSDDHATLVKKLKKVYSQDVQVLNQGTTSLLKFPLVPTRHPDGSAVMNEWLYKTISGHAKWQHVEFIQKPRFIIPTGKNVGFTATVFMEVSDNRAASTAKCLLQTDPGNAAFACAGDTQPTTVPPSPPGATLAPGITSLVPMGLPSKPTPYLTPSNAPTASATMGPHPASALSTGLVSTPRSSQSSRRLDLLG
ncbi:hypothetical protein AX14_001997 [Amanita brunnescens Koide BX004]|nr:hypothetical protein AX14_001997 [Amanita brunnescens Koide BX004]